MPTSSWSTFWWKVDSGSILLVNCVFTADSERLCHRPAVRRQQWEPCARPGAGPGTTLTASPLRHGGHGKPRLLPAEGKPGSMAATDTGWALQRHLPHCGVSHLGPDTAHCVVHPVRPLLKTVS